MSEKDDIGKDGADAGKDAKDVPPDEGQTVFDPNLSLISPPKTRAKPGPKTSAKAGPKAPTKTTTKTGTTKTGAKPTTASGRPRPAPAAAAKRGRIQVGDVLNHIFEVRRFIARGGMGEVFEGVNVNTDERVAIKVILPHLAADPAVQAMFRKEARTLTRISHPGLVQYRVLAQEPRLGVFYIVTEYIDGPNLSDRLPTLGISPLQLRGLLRKLAEGLAAAHVLGAIHRDISPDNVILAGDRIERAKIIDFGIAKDLDASTGTIIGEGFAGKLNYIAPEQLGDFGREIGPWTDVYSLGLTMMAVALGRDVNMGGTMVDAVDKRRAGLDLTAAPEDLQHVLAAMLQADPALRLRSMEEVLQLLDQSPPSPGGGMAGSGRRLAMLGAGGAIVIALTVGAAMLLRGGTPETAKPPVVAAPKPVAAATPAARPSEEIAASRAVEAEMRTLACSWLDLAKVSSQNGKVTLAFRGVSGKIPQALKRIEGALKGVGITPAAIDFSDVSPISDTTCGPIEAFVLVRADGPGRLAVAQRKFEMGVLPPSAGPSAGKVGAEAVFTLNLAGFDRDISLVGIDESGEMVQLAPSQTEVVANSKELGDRHYRFSFYTTHSGWSGILLLTGTGPFDQSLLTSRAGMRGSNWEERFLRLARERNWKSEMVWYRTVDEQPNGT